MLIQAFSQWEQGFQTKALLSFVKSLALWSCLIVTQDLHKVFWEYFQKHGLIQKCLYINVTVWVRWKICYGKSLKISNPLSVQDSMIYWCYCAGIVINWLWQKFALLVSWYHCEFQMEVSCFHGALVISESFRYPKCGQGTCVYILPVLVVVLIQLKF